jgi:hypothetical protein
MSAAGKAAAAPPLASTIVFFLFGVILLYAF